MTSQLIFKMPVTLLWSVLSGNEQKEQRATFGNGSPVGSAQHHSLGCTKPWGHTCGMRLRCPLPQAPLLDPCPAHPVYSFLILPKLCLERIEGFDLQEASLQERGISILRMWIISLGQASPLQPPSLQLGKEARRPLFCLQQIGFCGGGLSGCTVWIKDERGTHPQVATRGQQGASKGRSQGRVSISGGGELGLHLCSEEGIHPQVPGNHPRSLALTHCVQPAVCLLWEQPKDIA